MSQYAITPIYIYIYSHAIMSDNKLVKALIDAATLTGLVAGIGWIAKKVVKETFTADPSSNVMNYVKFTAVMVRDRISRDLTFFILPLSMLKSVRDTQREMFRKTLGMVL